MSAVTCPGCGGPAEITERFTLAGTGGPVAHIALSCTAGHHYRMAADQLEHRTPRPHQRKRGLWAISGAAVASRRYTSAGT